ncbi:MULTISPECIES: helix-turn-helix domain-containing protein [unclassified Streptomyces]|uniref:MmyB family transcriptional regulator n=1 Tax=unclassified Streptomyces TaxID=2593676 RepID=UPI000F6FDE03|nr:MULTISPECIES: helix-turn-helix domain-containing protein [unclassified Streptomyces]AZM64780.1 transcriptional regulator [Streptomyces sp. WAC 01438]RSM93652.1 transcriptional regulator [Streptomyces sp. WAC 01420]
MNEAPDLATLLRSWRARVRPADVGLPFRAGSRKTAGLRREEVAWLAGVSPDYVKRLEQGRARPSGAVLRALSRTLRLSEAEYELACRLAGHAAEGGGAVPQYIGAGAQRLLDRLTDTPVAVFDAAWTLIEHNAPWAALTCDDWHGRSGRSANIVWRVFTDDAGPVRHPHPEEHKASLVADLRDVAARYPADRELRDMIGALRRSSPEFARLWEGSAVAHHRSERKTLGHPHVGELELDCDVLSVHGFDLRIVVYTAAPGSEAADKLRLLTALGTDATAPPPMGAPSSSKVPGG